MVSDDFMTNDSSYIIINCTSDIGKARFLVSKKINHFKVSLIVRSTQVIILK